MVITTLKCWWFKVKALSQLALCEISSGSSMTCQKSSAVRVTASSLWQEISPIEMKMESPFLEWEIYLKHVINIEMNLRLSQALVESQRLLFLYLKRYYKKLFCPWHYLNKLGEKKDLWRSLDQRTLFLSWFWIRAYLKRVSFYRYFNN